MSSEKELCIPLWKKELLLRRRTLSRSISVGGGTTGLQLRVSCPPRRGEPSVPAALSSGAQLSSGEAGLSSRAVSPPVDFLHPVSAPTAAAGNMRFLEQDLSSSELIPQIKCVNDSDSDLKTKMVEEKPNKKPSFRKDTKISKALVKKDKVEDEDYHTDSSEELQYGPGIVNKLKSKYLSMTLRDNQKHSSRPSLSNMLRRATSLENMLDDDNCRQQKTHFIKKSYHSSSNKSSKISQHHAKYLGLAKGSESMKRARSMDTLLKNDSSSCLNQITTNMSSSMFANGSITPPSIINEDLIIVDSTPENKPVKTEDAELPPPDVVKQTLKLFEKSTSKKPSDVQSKVKIAVSKISSSNMKSNCVDSSVPKPRPVKPTLGPKPTISPDKRFVRPKVASPKRVFPVVSSLDRPKQLVLVPKVSSIADGKKFTSPLISPKISPSFEVKKVLSPTNESKIISLSFENKIIHSPSAQNKNFVQHSSNNKKMISPTSECKKLSSFAVESKNSVSPSLETKKIVSLTSENKTIISPTSESKKISSPTVESKNMVSSNSESKAFVSSISKNKKILSPTTESKKLVSPIVENQKIVPSSAESQDMVSPSTETKKIVYPLVECKKKIPLDGNTLSEKEVGEGEVVRVALSDEASLTPPTNSLPTGGVAARVTSTPLVPNKEEGWFNFKDTTWTSMSPVDADASSEEVDSPKYISQEARDGISKEGMCIKFSFDDKTLVSGDRSHLPGAVMPQATNTALIAGASELSPVKQVAVIRPVVMKNKASALTEQELEKNQINKARTGVEVVRGEVRGSPPPPPVTWAEKKTWQSQNTMVFNFSDRKSVPDYIENDGITLSNRRTNKCNGDGYRTETDGSGWGDEGDPTAGESTLTCTVRFVGDNILINGRSSLKKEPRLSKLRIQFNDEATTTFEYPSEESMADELPSSSPPGSQAPPSSSNLLSLGGGSLSSYTPCKTAAGGERFQLGVTRAAPPPPESTPAPAKQTDKEAEEDYLKPLDPDQVTPWSQETNTDMLF